MASSSSLSSSPSEARKEVAVAGETEKRNEETETGKDNEHDNKNKTENDHGESADAKNKNGDDGISADDNTKTSEADGKETSDANSNESSNRERKRTEEGNSKTDSTATTATATATTATSTPNAILTRPPKRARTAYFIFADAVRSQIQTDFPGEGVASQAKRIGLQWKSISDAEKDRYKQLALQEKEAVAVQLQAYREQHGDETDALENHSDHNTNHDLVFPVARIRKIAKLDPEVKTLSKEALQLVVKATELALAKLGGESVKVARLENRRTLLADDVAHVCYHRPLFSFLRDDLKDLTKAQKEHNQQKNGTSSGSGSSGTHSASDKLAAAAEGTRPLTSYFGAVQK